MICGVGVRMTGMPLDPLAPPLSPISPASSAWTTSHGEEEDAFFDHERAAEKDHDEGEDGEDEWVDDLDDVDAVDGEEMSVLPRLDEDAMADDDQLAAAVDELLLCDPAARAA